MLTALFIISAVANVIAFTMWQITRNELTQYRLLYAQLEHYLEDARAKYWDARHKLDKLEKSG